MNHKVKKLLYLIVVECQVNRKKLIDFWENINNISVKFKYSLFVKEKYDDYKTQNKNLTKKEIMFNLKQQWKNLNDDEKVKYIVIEEKKVRKKSVYNLFFKSQYKIIKEKNPTMSMGEISKTISNLWKSLSDEKKKEFIMSTKEDTSTSTVKDVKNNDTHEETKSLSNDENIIDLKHDNDIQDTDSSMNNENIVEKQQEELTLQNENFSELENKFAKIFTTHSDLNKNNKLLVKLANDKFLSNNEKQEINGFWLCLLDKSIDQAKKIYQNYYDEILPDNIELSEILHKIYNKERKNFISNKLSEKIDLIPKESLLLSKNETDFLNKKIQSFEKMEQWSLYCKFKALHPYFEEEEDAKEMSKEEIIENLVKYEKERIMKIKIDKILELN